MTTATSDQPFQQLLHYLKLSRGFDFTAYKQTSLMRRVVRRMQMVHVGDFEEYVDYLEVHPEEFRHLFNMVLIKVTGFFRDPTAWEFLAGVVIPSILSQRTNGDPVRVWSAGCASGEEAYSIAMLLREAMGIDEYKARVKIYATDADEAALTEGRQASYRARDVVASVPKHLVDSYFDAQGDRLLFSKELRRSVIFGRHDLLQDAPVSKIALLVCRNCLMYFNAEAQTRVLERFHFALDDTGFIFLGKAEMLFSRQDMFRPVELKRRVFTKVGSPFAGGRFQMLPPLNGDGDANDRADTERIRAAAFESDLLPQISIDGNDALRLANARARALFGLAAGDVGRPLRDLEISHRPFPVLALVERAKALGQSAISESDFAIHPTSGEPSYYDLHVTRLGDAQQLFGYHVTFIEVSKFRQLRDALTHSNQELETAYEEIQSTSEELETTNEELQSSNEELETTNEELQSTNEELETMNEELQSTNEELQATNDELRLRGDELNHLNAFLGSILTSMREGVIVLDAEMRVLAWNHKAEDLWGLRSDEVRGKHFLNLDIGLPVTDLTNAIRASLQVVGSNECRVKATNRRGKRIALQVVCSTLVGPASVSMSSPTPAIAGVTLIMKEMPDVDAD